MIGWPPSPWTAAVLGVVAGHCLRRAVPYLLRLRDRAMPFRRPWTEWTTAAAFALLAWLGVPWPAWLLTLVLVGGAACDLRSKLIPDAVTFGGAAFGLVASGLDPHLIRAVPLHDLLTLEFGLDYRGRLTGLALAVAGALVGFALVWAIRTLFGALAGVEAMGLGDAKLMLAVGAFVGPVGAALTLALSFFFGAVHGAGSALRTGKPHFAFGPSLSAAAWAVAAGSDRLMEAVGAFQAFLWTLPTWALVGGYGVLLAVVVLLLLRLRRKAAEYEEIIEEDYRGIEAELDD